MIQYEHDLDDFGSHHLQENEKFRLEFSMLLHHSL